MIDETNVIWKPRVPRTWLLPLDAVSKTTAHRISRAHLKNEIEQFDEPWVETFRRTFFATNVEGWCGWQGEGLGTFVPTDSAYLPHLKELNGTLFESLSGLNQTVGQTVYFTLF